MVVTNYDESLGLQQIPETDAVISIMEAIKNFQDLVKTHLQEGTDYSKEGLFGKNSKPSLLKPGAEKIMSLLRCRPQYEILAEKEDFDKPLFYYKIRCLMIHIGDNAVWGDGIGSCNSMEKRYTWDRWKKTSRPFEFSDVNTIQKMAQKRAMVQSVLTLGRLSNLFTQDIEDYTEHPNASGKPRSKPKKKTETTGKDMLTQEEKQQLMDWAETYPFIKSELSGKPWSEITLKDFTRIKDTIETMEDEAINEDVPI